MKKLIILAASTAMLALSTPAMASSHEGGCATVKGEWMSEDAIKAKATELGYEVRRVKKEDGCYEVYGIGKDKSLVEIYMNPVTGEVVNIEKKS